MASATGAPTRSFALTRDAKRALDSAAVGGGAEPDTSLRLVKTSSRSSNLTTLHCRAPEAPGKAPSVRRLRGPCRGAVFPTLASML